MSETGQDASGGDPLLDLPPEQFVASLEPHERVLLDLKEQLYAGSWDRILQDLKARMEGQTYLYKLSQTIARDLAAIERMKSYEVRQQVDLAKLLKKHS